MIQKLYPGGKPKAFNISYDDGVLQDVRFVALLNKYGLKGTFNLNSGLMKTGFSWVHETIILPSARVTARFILKPISVLSNDVFAAVFSSAKISKTNKTPFSIRL